MAPGTCVLRKTVVEDLNPVDTSAEEDLPLQIGRLVLAACQMLCKALSADLAELTLQSMSPCTWPDASLGLPQPGIVYAPVITKGYLLRIQRRTDIFVFHSSIQGPPVCPELRPPLTLGADHPLIANAMLDLAEQLHTSFSSISLDRAEIKVGDCPAESQMALDTQKSGQEQNLYVVLRCGDQTYTFLGPPKGPLTMQA